MSKRRNEMMSMIRQEPFSYRAAYDADNNVEYEGWATPGNPTTGAHWIIAKHTYTSGNMTATTWAQDSDEVVGQFTNIWDNYASLTYV